MLHLSATAPGCHRVGPVLLAYCGPVLKRIIQKTIQQHPLIFLGLLVFWTDWTGRTGFCDRASPRACEQRSVLGVDDLIDSDMSHLSHR